MEVKVEPAKRAQFAVQYCASLAHDDGVGLIRTETGRTDDVAIRKSRIGLQQDFE